MATRGGGTILVGVKDDRSIVGANIGAGEVERLVQQVLANTDPRLYLRISDTIHDGHRVLRLDVPPGDGPHLAFGRAFHRVGPATVAMTRDEYERRLLDRLRESSGFERRYVEGATADRLDDGAVRDWAQQAKGRLKNLTGNEPAISIVERLHLVQGPRVTIAGWLLFSAEPDALPPPLTPAMLRERHPSVPPTPLVARALFLAGYIEEWGTGTLVVIEAMRENGNPEPRFEADASGVRVFLPFKGKASHALNAREKAGLKGLKAGELFSPGEYAGRAKVSLRTAATDLARLAAQGIVVRSGVGRATRWSRT